MHENGFFNVVKDSEVPALYNKSLDKTFFSLSVVVDTGTGRMMKYGVTDDMLEYYKQASEAAKGLAIDGMDSEISIINIMDMSTEIGLDNACTFLNYLCSDVEPELYKKLVLANEVEMMSMLVRLREEYKL